MSTRTFFLLALVALSAFLLSTRFTANADNGAPAVGHNARFQIQRAEITYSTGAAGEKPFSAANTLLLDSATGETHMLWPGGKDSARKYEWVPVTKQKLPPVE